METVVKNVKQIETGKGSDLIIEISNTIEGRNDKGEAIETNIVSAGMVLDFAELDDMGLLLKSMTCNQPTPQALNLYLMGQKIEIERKLLKPGEKNLAGQEVKNECFSTKIVKITREPKKLLEDTLQQMIFAGKAQKVVEKKVVDAKSFFE